MDQRLEALYRKFETFEDKRNKLYERDAELESTLSELHGELEQADGEEAQKLEAKIDELHRAQIKLHTKAIKFGYKQLDSLNFMLAIKEDFIGRLQVYLETEGPARHEPNDGLEEPNDIPEIDRNIEFGTTEHCFDNADAIDCLRAIAQDVRTQLREEHYRSEELHADIADLREQHFELELKGYFVNEQGEEIFSEIEQHWQAKDELHNKMEAYHIWSEELHHEGDEISERLHELSQCLRSCETDENIEQVQQEFDELYARHVEIKASLIEIQLIKKDIQSDINNHLEILVGLGQNLLANGMVQPEVTE